jgi:hypothetical protein
MKHSKLRRQVAVVDTLPTLAKNKKVQGLLRKEWGAERLKSILAMMRAGKLEGSLGNEIHDFFLDEISNEAKTAWSGSAKGSFGPYPVEIKEYGGVYFVWAQEFDRVGYFLDIEAAKSYVDQNWMGEVEEDNP